MEGVEYVNAKPYIDKELDRRAVIDFLESLKRFEKKMCSDMVREIIYESYNKKGFKNYMVRAKLRGLIR